MAYGRQHQQNAAQFKELDGNELANDLEKAIVLLGKAQNEVSYLRRLKILVHFNKEKRSTAAILKKNHQLIGLVE